MSMPPAIQPATQVKTNVNVTFTVRRAGTSTKQRIRIIRFKESEDRPSFIDYEAGNVGPAAEKFAPQM